MARDEVARDEVSEDEVSGIKCPGMKFCDEVSRKSGMKWLGMQDC